MFGSLKAFPSVHPFILSIVSFLLAVLAVSGLEVWLTELAFARYKNSLKKLGFGKEEYFESRFHYESVKKAESVFLSIVEEYNLGKITKINYRDRYFENKLPLYNQRKPRIRFRQRDKESGEGVMQAVQIVYTKASEIAKRELGQHRFFPIRKEKLYFEFKDKMPWKVDEIIDKRVRRIVRRAQKSQKFIDVSFQRKVSNRANSILVSLDHLKDKTAVIELKVFKDRRLLKKAMRHVMRQGGLQITYGKEELTMMSAV